jgi:tRNA-Thr(GGU) m(6)t(6)A37 methyltransferase TsaA
MSQTVTLHPIGTIHTPWRSIAECPRNGRQRDPAPACSVHVFPEYVAGLQSLDGFSHLILLYLLHETKAPALVFTPPFDTHPRGIFATRAPWRPNPIGLSVVAFDAGSFERSLPGLPRRDAIARHQTLFADH